MNTPRSLLIQWIEQGLIRNTNVRDALTLAGVYPQGSRWLKFIDRLTLWAGSMALALSLVFFIAYNWTRFDRFAKFGLVEAGILATLVLYWLFHERGMAGKVLLFLASLQVGALLALYGQTYQTGADPWTLFFFWALLILPWVLIARFVALWIFWLGLLNLSLFLYFNTFGGLLWGLPSLDSSITMLLFVFYTLCLVVWEGLASRFRWLNERWAVRLLATASGFTVSWLAVISIFDFEDSVLVPMWFAWTIGLLVTYRWFIRDLFMLAGICLSGTVVIIALIAQSVFNDFDSGGFLLLAMVLILLGTGSALWLRSVHREWQL